MSETAGLKSGATLRDGKYRIEKVLGKGSFGITYLATAKFTTQGNLGQMEVTAKVAVKEFFMSEVNARKSDGSTVEGSSGSVFVNYRKKFRKEAENLSKLEYPGIVRVFDVFDENNTTYYVMEFLEGDNLDDYIMKQGHLPEEEAAAAINEMGNALAYMHSCNMLHLDIKPKNIMRRRDGRYYLIDFGLSKQFNVEGEPESSTSIGLGTPGYAPLEQSGYKQDGSFPATLDVYALAATMFKMLTGERPPEATFILNDGFPVGKLQAAGVSADTIKAIRHGMSAIKKQRTQSVKGFLKELHSPGESTREEEETTIDTHNQGGSQRHGGMGNDNGSQGSSSGPIRLTDPDWEPEHVNKSRKWLWITVGTVVLAACILLLFSNKKSDATEGETSQAPQTDIPLQAAVDEYPPVVNMAWDSPLGMATYTGAVMPDTLGGDTMIPHGKGLALITSGRYKGCIYDGEFYNGRYEGLATYNTADGDEFTGTFKNNQYSYGTYRNKKTGEYFTGSFKNGVADEGNWYDKKGNVISD